MPLDDIAPDPASAARAKEADLIELSKMRALSDESMLAYFLSAIEVRAKLLQQLLPADPNDPQQKIVAEVRHKIDTFTQWCPLTGHNWRNSAWCDAYRLELMLALAEPTIKLVSELEQRLDEADEEKVPAAARLRKACTRTIAQTIGEKGEMVPIGKEVEATLRSQLVNVIEETQYHLKRKFTGRMIQKQATYKIILAAIVSFLLFISPYAAIVFRYALGWLDTTHWVNSWVGLPLFTALTAGLFGAFFSRLLFIQKSWNTLSLDELKAARELSSIILRGTVGMCGAAFVFFFLHSNLIGGELLPDFERMGLVTRRDSYPMLILPNRELALLAVWSFLAGFSERLVPNMLATTDTTLGKGSSEVRPPNN